MKTNNETQTSKKQDLTIQNRGAQQCRNPKLEDIICEVMSHVQENCPNIKRYRVCRAGRAGTWRKGHVGVKISTLSLYGL